MRLRSPTPIDFEVDPLSADFELIADEVFEVREVSSHAAMQLLADGWVRVPDREPNPQTVKMLARRPIWNDGGQN